MTVNLSLAIAAGLFTWGVLELLGVDLAVPLAILVAIFDLVPLIGLTIGGLVVAVVAALHSFPDALIIWVVAFLVFQQLQDRVVQPMLYGRAVKVNPLVAIVALLAGAQILGILGALLAIPVAASIAVVFKALRGVRPRRRCSAARLSRAAMPTPAVGGGPRAARSTTRSRSAPRRAASSSRCGRRAAPTASGRPSRNAPIRRQERDQQPEQAPSRTSPSRS